MQTLIIEPSAKSPKVNFDQHTGVLELFGKSIPENAHDLYMPLLQWLDEYVQIPAANTIFLFKLSYFNSSSTEYILEIMKRLESMHSKGHRVEVKWFHDQDDEDMEQVGADFRMMLQLPIDMVVNEDDEDELPARW